MSEPTIKKAPAKKAPAKVTTAAAAKKPKKPTDRQEKGGSLLFSARPEDTPGWELMRPFEEIPVWEQMPLISMFHKAMGESSGMSDEEFANLSVEERERIKKEGEERDFDVTILGELAFMLRKFAKDEEEYTKFCSGGGALTRTLNLCMAWVGQMGESISSEDS